MSKTCKCLRSPFPDIGMGIYPDKEDGVIEATHLLVKK
jgi:hypothetical protein